jgi:hypothetical protein
MADVALESRDDPHFTSMFMRRLPLFTFGFAAISGLTSLSAVAGDLEIHVGIKVGARDVHTERTDEAPSKVKAQERPVFELGRKERAVLSWRANNGSVSRKFEDVLMHFFVVEEARAGQREVPKLDKGVVYEGALTMDFLPKSMADWQMSLTIPEPGNYLVRVETIGLAPKEGRERFAAMDLVVK